LPIFFYQNIKPRGQFGRHLSCLGTAAQTSSEPASGLIWILDLDRGVRVSGVTGRSSDGSPQWAGFGRRGCQASLAEAGRTDHGGRINQLIFV
jgi:hypothetical protein